MIGLNVLVCDDHALMRRALALVVGELAPGAAVLTARDWPEAWSLAEQTAGLSLCLIDLQMPGMAALDGLRGLQTRAPDARLVVVTGSENDADLFGALETGVDGFIPKTAEPEVMSAALGLV